VLSSFLHAALSGCRWDQGADVPEDEIAVRLTFTCEPGTCRCEAPILDFDDCGDALQAWVDTAYARGLVYQRSCTEHLFDLAYGHFRPDSDPCSADASVYRWADCEDECQVFAGTDGIGQPCQSAGRRMSNCAPELLCGVDGVCHEPCDRPVEIPEGRPCGYFTHGYLEETCAAGLVCDPTTSVCVASTPNASDCEPAASTCAPDSWCDTIGLSCAARLDEGAACEEHDQCLSRACDGNCLPPDPYLCQHPYF
jgi:hypothetical protein